MNKPMVIYHAGCPDGAGSALAAFERFGERAVYQPGQYDAAQVYVLDGQDVFLVDYSWPRDVIESMRARGHRVVVIDHHATARDRLAGLTDCLFDMDHSGAVLTWRYFHPETPVPELLLYIEDRDLWRFLLPHSKEISAALKANGCCNDFMTLLPILRDWKPDGDDGIPQGSKRLLIAEGKAIVRAESAMIDTMTKCALRLNWEGHPTAVVNATVIFSETAEKAYQRHDAAIGAYWFFDASRRVYQVGLRSPQDGPDVSAIATKYGGGGHPHSAGFNVTKLPNGWIPETR